jgi:hypothetical protein
MYADFLGLLGRGYSPTRIKGLVFCVTASSLSTDLVLDGQFGAMMSVSLTNEGPVTLTIDSRKFEYTPVVETVPKKKPTNVDKSTGLSETK